MEASIIKKRVQGNQRGIQIVYYILGLVEVLLGVRVAFKLLGANPGSSFVSAIYALTEVFLLPFTGIFRSVETEGIETQAVLEPAIIIAMIVYAVVAWGIVRLLEINRLSQNRRSW